MDNPGVADTHALAGGLRALGGGQWKEARAAFETALAERESPEALDGLGMALFGLGEFDAAITAQERAFVGFRARGETRYPAVLAAYWLSFSYAAVRGNLAAASGWLERGKRLAEDSGDCPERGWVELSCALATADLDAKEGHVAAASAIAERFGDTDLMFDAMAYAGVCLVERGRVADGMRRVDEAAAAATSGEVRNLAAAGEIYCKMLLACELTLDVRRAAEWTTVAQAFADRTGIVWASAICRMHYGGILIAAGRWPEAEYELTASVRLYDATFRALRSGAIVRLADLRVRQARIEEAERLLTGDVGDVLAAQPRAAEVLARVHLARGHADLAVTVLRRVLGDGEADVCQVAARALLAEAELAAGRVGEARAVCAVLRLAGGAAPTPVQAAFTAYADGIVGASTGDEGALTRLEAALAGFATAGLPYEEAQTRLGLARAIGATRPEVAAAEARAALAVFTRLGCKPYKDAAAAVLRSLGVRGWTGPRDVGILSHRELEVLGLVGLGLSNPEIAARLFISRKTAAHHVSSVLAKLGLRNRAEAAAHAAALSANPAPPSDPGTRAG